MPITATLDNLGKPAWIALMILGFVVWWPVGLATLAFVFGSGRMGCGSRSHWQQKMDQFRDKMGGGPGWGPSSSGNRAFDNYRTETLRRLEEEQREFREFLDRLRVAKDKTEFDQFMADRRNRPQNEPPRPTV